MIHSVADFFDSFNGIVLTILVIGWALFAGLFFYLRYGIPEVRQERKERKEQNDQKRNVPEIERRTKERVEQVRRERENKARERKELEKTQSDGKHLNPFATINVLMNCYMRVSEMFAAIKNLDMARAAIPFPLQDFPRSNKLLPPLPGAFLETDLTIMDGSTTRAILTFSFCGERLVNFNIQIFAAEHFKEIAVKEALHNGLLPYVASKTGEVWEDHPLIEGLFNTDDARGLVHHARLHLEGPVTVSASLMDRSMSGL